MPTIKGSMVGGVRAGIMETNDRICPKMKSYNKRYGGQLGAALFMITTAVVLIDQVVDFFGKPVNINRQHNSIPHERRR